MEGRRFYEGRRRGQIPATKRRYRRGSGSPSPAASSTRVVVVDEMDELMGTKRGVQVELALARMRRICPGMRTWALSATIGKVEVALSYGDLRVRGV